MPRWLYLDKMTDNWKSIARREYVLFLWLLMGGLLLLPVAVYIVGQLIFGEYGGTGFTAFYGMFYSELLSGARSVWFLILSPYLIWQLLRLTLRAFKIAGDR